MNITVRLDDITPDMDWERFYKFKALLDQYQAKPLIGVVPDNRDELLKGSGSPMDPEPFFEYIRQLQKEGWTVAMHGYQHIYGTSKGGIFPLNHFSEFAGEPLEEQRKKIAAGRQILENHGVHTDIFMAPGHSYDRNTLTALMENGFSEMTDGFGDRPYLFHGMTFYPISFLLSRTLQKKNGYSTMVVHTGTVSDQDLDHYRAYFQKEGVQWISYEEYRKCPREVRHFPGRIREYLLAAFKNLAGRIRNR